jgi:hypothetical protein
MDEREGVGGCGDSREICSKEEEDR